MVVATKISNHLVQKRLGNRQHMSLYVLQGLCPSPRVEMKFKSQNKEKVHGNDFVHRSFGPNAEHAIIVIFKHFFHAKILEKNPS